jgi:hypothetical protein
MLLKVFYLDDERDLLDIFQDCFSGPEIEITTFLDSNKFFSGCRSGKS